ncbi:MAG: hypothetical protein ACRDGM_08270 [bacterium]
MKARTILACLAVLFAGVGLVFASDAQMGTWKLNESKSKLSPGATKNHTVVYEAAGDDIKITVDGVDKEGKAVHNEWTGKFDGKDYPVTGDPNSDARSYKKVDDYTLEMTIKKGGKVTATGRIEVSADGKTRTVTTTGTEASGKKVTNIGVYDKE